MAPGVYIVRILGGLILTGFHSGFTWQTYSSYMGKFSQVILHCVSLRQRLKYLPYDPRVWQKFQTGPRVISLRNFSNSMNLTLTHFMDYKSQY
jgi:hypothetical protein